jgi:hypothetical protein
MGVEIKKQEDERSREIERQKKSASYWKAWDEEYGETMHYTEEENDLIQKNNN